nr:hypothetical protein HK105_003134 [Polyrhizophydium stewartii]
MFGSLQDKYVPFDGALSLCSDLHHSTHTARANGGQPNPSHTHTAEEVLSTSLPPSTASFWGVEDAIKEMASLFNARLARIPRVHRFNVHFPALEDPERIGTLFSSDPLGRMAHLAMIEDPAMIDMSIVALEASPGAGASRKLPVTAEFRKAAAALPLLELERARAAALSDPNASGPSWLALPRETRKPDPALAPPRTSRARRFRSKQAVAELVSRTAPDVSYLSRLAQRRVQHQVRFASRLGMRRADLHNNPRLGSLLHEWNSAPPGSGEPMSSLSKAVELRWAAQASYPPPSNKSTQGLRASLHPSPRSHVDDESSSDNGGHSDSDSAGSSADSARGVLTQKSVAVPSSMAEFDQDAFDGSSVLEIRNGREGFRELVKQVADEQLRRQEEYGEKGFRKSAVRIIRRRVIDIAQRFLQKHHAQLRVPNHIPTQQEDPAGVAVVDVLREIYPNFPARQEEPVGARTVAQGLDARHDALQKKFGAWCEGCEPAGAIDR